MTPNLLYARQLFIFGSRAEKQANVLGVGRVVFPQRPETASDILLRRHFTGRWLRLRLSIVSSRGTGLMIGYSETRGSIGEQLWQRETIGSQVVIQDRFHVQGDTGVRYHSRACFCRRVNAKGEPGSAFGEKSARADRTFSDRPHWPGVAHRI